ncbi:MAG: dockerin type I domain-containing protein [Ruminococcus sp.]
MKKIISLASALILGFSAVPVSASAAELDLSAYDFSNCDYNLDGKVTLVDARYQLAYYAEKITGTKDSALTDEQREYISANGDIDGDGKIIPRDGSILLNYLAKNFVPGDVNEDGKITPADASILLKHYAYKSTGGSRNDFDSPTDPQSVQWTACESYGDMNGDDKISASDGAEILKIYAENALAVQ